MNTNTLSKSKLTHRHHYSYILMWLIITIIVISSSPENRKLHLDQINVPGLAIYIVIMAVVYNMLLNLKISNRLWVLAHFLSFFFISYFIPNNWILVLTYALIWEIYEDYKETSDPTYDESTRKKEFDILGFALGYYIGNLVFS